MLSGVLTNGTRVQLAEGEHYRLKPGEYAKTGDEWHACCPCDGRLVANLSAHQVDEHADGTITVTPSILCTRGRDVKDGLRWRWHGFIERGVWREC